MGLRSGLRVKVRVQSAELHISLNKLGALCDFCLQDSDVALEGRF